MNILKKWRARRVPSYETGGFRDPEIERLQEEQAPDFDADDLKETIAKAIPRRPRRDKTS
jgi:hypothetical protein